MLPKAHPIQLMVQVKRLPVHETRLHLQEFKIHLRQVDRAQQLHPLPVHPKRIHQTLRYQIKVVKRQES